MIVFFKAQLSSLIATIVDFGFTILFVEITGTSYILSTTIGAVAGAVTNFSINKFWSFNNGKGDLKKQGLRYALVWVGSIILNVFGSNLFLNTFKTPYIFSKITVALFVGFAFNYTLQKYYVFRTADETRKI